MRALRFFPKRLGSMGVGSAGAVTAGACVLCVAGTYQTGSGPRPEDVRVVHGVHAVMPPG